MIILAVNGWTSWVRVFRLISERQHLATATNLVILTPTSFRPQYLCLRTRMRLRFVRWWSSGRRPRRLVKNTLIRWLFFRVRSTHQYHFRYFTSEYAMLYAETGRVLSPRLLTSAGPR